jgi:hypothetical protein
MYDLNKTPIEYLEQNIGKILHKFLGKMVINRELHNVCQEIMSALKRTDQIQALPFELNIQDYYIFMVRQDCFGDTLVEIDGRIITDPEQRYFFLECFDSGRNIRFNFSKSVQQDIEFWSNRNA